MDGEDWGGMGYKQQRRRRRHRAEENEAAAWRKAELLGRKKEGEVRRGQERGEGQVVMNVLLFPAQLSAGTTAGAVTLGHL